MDKPLIANCCQIHFIIQHNYLTLVSEISMMLENVSDLQDTEPFE